MGMDRKSFLRVAAAGGLGLLFGGASGPPPSWRERGVARVAVERQSLAMGSLISFQAVGPTEADGYEAIRRAERVFRRLDRVFSMYDPRSEMGRLSARSGRAPVRVSEDARRLLRYAKKISRESEGHFDITVEPAMRQWGFRGNSPQRVNPPTDAELRELERLTGSEKIILSGQGVFLEETGMALDAGGIAGGYALDQALAEMTECEISAAFINFSGDIRCFGAPLDGGGWPVRIWDPRSGRPLPDPVILHNQALSTSGAYRNRRISPAGRSWGHLLLPSRAEPVEPYRSVTAIHSRAMAADAWSTAIYVGASPPENLRTILLR